ncbi:hypothetical protein CWN49_20810 [Klebsiella michiganensis]|uniref:Uncharacterized protein n=1 Tax=Klebsiella michiganensis TaxID=1134687 RepID=A0A2J5PLC3_9ENTR|nr:hypothetical protein CWN49_20810 [Klebsiella michiganensis]
MPGSRRKRLTRATGSQTAVARAGALRRPREQRAEWHNFPEAMLRICPCYRPADGGEPVAPVRR